MARVVKYASAPVALCLAGWECHLIFSILAGQSSHPTARHVMWVLTHGLLEHCRKTIATRCMCLCAVCRGWYVCHQG
jgi:hypothetical protein